MNRKSIFGVLIGVTVFGAVVATIEWSFPAFQVIAAFIVAWALALGFANFRNAGVLACMTAVLLLVTYFAVRERWIGMTAGALAGVLVGFLMHLGWIVPHRPFSRAKYQEDMRETASSTSEEGTQSGR